MLSTAQNMKKHPKQTLFFMINIQSDEWYLKAQYLK